MGEHLMARSVIQNLTKAEIEKLEPKAAMYRLPAGGCKGLVLQVTPAGVMSWMLRFRHLGRQVNHTLENGQWPGMTVSQAQKAGLALWGRIGKGENPSATKQEARKAQTVAELVTLFLKEHLPTLKKSTRDEYERIIKTRISPAMGTKKVKDIRPADIARLLSKIRTETRTGIMANRTRAVLSKMFTLAELWGLREGQLNPCRGQVRADEIPRARHLSDKELVALGAVLREPPALLSGDTFALAALHLILLSGLRKSEVIGNKVREIPALRWASVDLEAAVIRLDQHKTARKAGARTVPLCSAACELLERLPHVLGNPYVIPGGRIGESLMNLQKPWDRVCAAVGTLQERGGVNIADVTIHDLRRSYASLATRMGYPKLIVSALLGHSASDPTEGYARMGTDPLRDVVETVGARMAGLLSGLIDLEAEAKAAKAQAAARRTVKSA